MTISDDVSQRLAKTESVREEAEKRVEAMRAELEACKVASDQKVKEAKQRLQQVCTHM